MQLNCTGRDIYVASRHVFPTLVKTRKIKENQSSDNINILLICKFWPLLEHGLKSKQNVHLFAFNSQYTLFSCHKSSSNNVDLIWWSKTDSFSVTGIELVAPETPDSI
jgi:hypothetical protein